MREAVAFQTMHGVHCVLTKMDVLKMHPKAVEIHDVLQSETRAEESARTRRCCLLQVPAPKPFAFLCLEGWLQTAAVRTPPC